MTVDPGLRGCELPLATGESCGLVAPRRCGRCGRAMCESHNAGTPAVGGGRLLGGRCVECEAASAAETMAAATAKTDAYAAGWDRIRDIARALAAAGSPGMETRRLITGCEKRRFRKPEPQYTTLGPAWPVGVWAWYYTIKNRDTNFTTTAELETGVTEAGTTIPLGIIDGHRPISVSNMRPDEVVARLKKIADAFGVPV